MDNHKKSETLTPACNVWKSVTDVLPRRVHFCMVRILRLENSVMHTAAFQRLSWTDARLGVALRVMVFYPAAAPEVDLPLGPYLLRAAEAADVSVSHCPLIIISHGSGGSMLSWHEHACALARAGFMVCVPEHPYNNVFDNSKEGRMEVFVERCYQVSQCIDEMLRHDVFGRAVDVERIGYVGHSAGANVGMVLVGARPMDVQQHRQQFGLMLHEQESDQAPEHLHTEPRIRAAALFAMVPTWFQYPGALRNVQASLLLVNAELDAYIPVPLGGDFVDSSECKATVHQEVVPGAGHFSFLSSFETQAAQRIGAPAKDPPGFDRVAYSLKLQTQLVNFFQTELK